MLNLHMLVAGMAGLGACASSYLATRYFQRRLTQPLLAPRILADLRTLVSDSEAENFLRVYRRLMANVARFACTRLILATLAVAPVIALYLVSSSVWDSVTTWRSSYVEVRPPQPLWVRTSQGTYALETGQHNFPLASSQNSEAQILIQDQPAASIRLRSKQAMAASPLQRLGLICIGFEVFDLSEPARPAVTTIVSRPAADDTNIFWPWLSDAELVFLATASLGSLALAQVMRRRK